ncbi:hypothetical protein KBC03_04695 [Patescibacteria group bacterium]|nr:hypothetical protein [Patescibacteria group bacterium]
MSELKDDICATHRDRIITLWNLAHQKKILLKCGDYSKDLVSYDRKHQDELNVALQISEKFYFDTDYFTQLTTKYPHLLEQKDEKYYKHKMHIEANYTKIRDAFIHHDKIALWELVERLQYPPVEHSKINELIYQF